MADITQTSPGRSNVDCYDAAENFEHGHDQNLTHNVDSGVGHFTIVWLGSPVKGLPYYGYYVNCYGNITDVKAP